MATSRSACTRLTSNSTVSRSVLTGCLGRSGEETVRENLAQCERPNYGLANDPIRISYTFESEIFNTPSYEIVVEGRTIRYVDSSRLAHARFTSLSAKEPTAIPWLETFKR